MTRKQLTRLSEKLARIGFDLRHDVDRLQSAKRWELATTVHQACNALDHASLTIHRAAKEA